jgi:hypothetical protein
VLDHAVADRPAAPVLLARVLVLVGVGDRIAHLADPHDRRR